MATAAQVIRARAVEANQREAAGRGLATSSAPDFPSVSQVQQRPIASPQTPVLLMRRRETQRQVSV